MPCALLRKCTSLPTLRSPRAAKGGTAPATEADVLLEGLNMSEPWAMLILENLRFLSKLSIPFPPVDRLLSDDLP